ncbi:MAG: hypothetical protein GY816_00235 [Cytophagales bacterium]|nr:hypothetical protein [Cytophagales bacterium]
MTNILVIIKKDADATLNTLVGEFKKSNEVETLDLRENKNYDEIVDKIEKCDKAICW